MNKVLGFLFLMLPVPVVGDGLAMILGEGIDETIAEEIVEQLQQGLVLSEGEYLLNKLDPIQLEEITRIEKSEEGYEVTVGGFPGCKRILAVLRRCDVQMLQCVWYNNYTKGRYVCT